jgi:predicted  nucleic acid-binding Zn-ribbon protein
MQDLDNSLVNLNTAIQRKNQQGDDYVRMVNALIEEITNFLNGLQQNNDNSAALQQELNVANERIRRLTEENARTQEQLRAVEARANEVQERERVCNEALARLRQDGQGNAEEIRRLQEELANVQQAVQQTNAQRDELLRQLEERTGRIQENVAQIAQMHINKEDSDELTANSQRLRALIAGLVAARGPGGAGAGAGSRGAGGAGAGAGAGSRGAGGAGAGAGAGAGFSVRNAIDLGVRAAGYQPRAAGGADRGQQIRVAREPNTAPGQGPLVNPIPPRDQNAGKTKRRRGKKSMYRGGYVEKLRAKKTRKRTRTSKRRSGRKSTASSSSSSSASSNSRQKAMQGRKM